MKSFFSDKPNTNEQTIIIIGAARSGTSTPTSVLHHAGVYLGEYTNEYQYEDKHLRLDLEKWGIGDKSQINEFRKIIDERNRRYKIWGWKDVNIVWYLKDILSLLRNPTFIFTSRNPLHVGYSSYVKDSNHHEVPDNYRFQSYRSAVRQVSKQYELLDQDIPIAILDFDEMKNKLVTKSLFDWLGIDYKESIQDCIGDTYYNKEG